MDRDGFDELFVDLPVQARNDVAVLDNESDYCDKQTECVGINQLNNELEQARNAAFQAMMMSSELGMMLRFLQSGMQSKNFADLSEAMFAVLEAMNLKASLHIHYDRFAETYVDDGKSRPIESEIFETCRNGQRIIDFKQHTIFNQSNCSLLIRNMPIDNPERYGMLRDNLCIFLDVVQNRVDSLILEKKANSLRQLMDISLGVIQNILLEMDAQQCAFTNNTSQVIDDMSVQLKSDFSTLNLDQIEEEKLMANFEAGHEQLSGMFETSAKANKQIRSVLEALLGSLSLNAPG
jgi:hypothetical protein